MEQVDVEVEKYTQALDKIDSLNEASLKRTNQTARQIQDQMQQNVNTLKSRTFQNIAKETGCGIYKYL